MSTSVLISKLKAYFEIHELVDEEVFEKFGEKAWRFFDPRTLETLLILRENLNKPITINNWKWGGSFSQRGLRHNQSDLVRNKTSIYLSAHIRGCAIDLDVKYMTANEVRQWIVDNSDLFPHKIRLERKLRGNYISWVHIDNDYEIDNPHIYLFDV